MSASPSNPNAEEISFEEVGPSSSRRLAASAAVLSAAAASILVTPNCRYGHGNLTLVIPEKDSNGETMQWGYVPAKMPSLVFEGDLYICVSCGYTEFFYNNPNLTVLNNEVNGGVNGGG